MRLRLSLPGVTLLACLPFWAAGLKAAFNPHAKPDRTLSIRVTPRGLDLRAPAAPVAGYPVVIVGHQDATRP